MVGFWDNPEATAQRMTQDQFVLTGDIGKLDQNGYLYVLDRKDDMIISGGYNIWPAELENVIQGHPAVIEVAVVRSEEHTSELQSLMRISYAVFCLKKKT